MTNVRNKNKQKCIDDPIGQICGRCPQLKSGWWSIKCRLYVFDISGQVLRRTFGHWLILKVEGWINYQCKAAPLIEKQLRWLG